MFPIVMSVRKIGDGHTLFFVEFKGKRFGYRGEVGFEKISLWETGQTILENRRWGVAFVDGDYLRLLCTSKDRSTTGYQYQHIHHYTSSDGIKFSGNGIICRGSAPWIYKEGDKIYFYYHVLDHGWHHIYVREGFRVRPQLILSSKEVYSAPSVMKWNDHYIMTLEHRKDAGEPWQTVIAKMNTPTDILEDFSPFLGDWQACCFLHNGYITFSQKGEHGWDMRQAELR